MKNVLNLLPMKQSVNISVIGSTAESSVGVNEENTPMGNTTVNVSFYAGS